MISAFFRPAVTASVHVLHRLPLVSLADRATPKEPHLTATGVRAFG